MTALVRMIITGWHRTQDKRMTVLGIKYNSTALVIMRHNTTDLHLFTKHNRTALVGMEHTTSEEHWLTGWSAWDTTRQQRTQHKWTPLVPTGIEKHL